MSDADSEICAECHAQEGRDGANEETRLEHVDKSVFVDLLVKVSTYASTLLLCRGGKVWCLYLWIFMSWKTETSVQFTLRLYKYVCGLKLSPGLAFCQESSLDRDSQSQAPSE